MRLFISAGEPSGDLHGANLLRCLRSLDPNVVCAGFGGDRLRAAGCDLLYPLAQQAIMGLSGIVREVPTLWRIRKRASEWMAANRPDAVVLIDYPGFHWWLASTAKSHRVPVISFVPPQLWSWASFRVKRVRKYFDHVLCTLPFEEPWYHARGVPYARYIGHPYFDELAEQRLDAAFVAGQRQRPGPVVALLPGSRDGEIARNLDTLVGTARTVAAARPDVRFLFACFKDDHRRRVEARLADDPIRAECHVGRTAEIIQVAEACAAVSGSVGLELLYHGTPSVVVYRLKEVSIRFLHMILNVPFISIVNLLAERELFPEFLTSRDPSSQVAGHLLGWLNDPTSAATVRQHLTDLRQQVGQPGACRRAAEVVAAVAGVRRTAAA